MWFTDERGNKVNTENNKPGISSNQMHDKGSDVVAETVHEKPKDSGKLGEDYHIYRIWQYESDDGGGDRQEVAHVKAKNIEDAIEFVKDYYFEKSAQKHLNEDGDDEFATVDISVSYDQNGNEVDEVPDGMEDEYSYRTFGFQIDQADDAGEDFKTIYGGNDFFDVTDGKVKTKGKTTADRIKEEGGIERAFYNNAGKGFESGNKDNDYNLNNPHPVIHTD